jgi:pyruvate/2-oxoacid:ferredoxin oxidoreductase alpha subunit
VPQVTAKVVRTPEIGGVECISKVVMGNHAAAYGAMLSRVQVIAAYPITPQSPIIEKLAEHVAAGHLDARYITVESEHSALMAAAGASAAGARAFSATSSQGLALMHEPLHWVSGMRLPIVMVNCNRGLGAPWVLFADHIDSMAQRDTGWIQIYCESNQEVLDSVIQGYKTAEQIKLPIMLNLDGFLLTHTSEPVSIPSQRLVDQYLPTYAPEIRLDVKSPRMFGGVALPPQYYQLRFKMNETMEVAKTVIRESDRQFREIFGRGYGLVDSYLVEDADVVLMAAGTIASTAKAVVQELRREGKRVGLLRLRVFRPFPVEELRSSLRGEQKVAIIDRAVSLGHCGILHSELKSGLYDSGHRPTLFGFVAGTGGVDVTPRTLRAIANYTYAHDVPSAEVVWVGTATGRHDCSGGDCADFN